jgi:hypothetical protein
MPDDEEIRECGTCVYCILDLIGYYCTNSACRGYTSGEMDHCFRWEQREGD